VPANTRDRGRSHSGGRGERRVLLLVRRLFDQPVGLPFGKRVGRLLGVASEFLRHFRIEWLLGIGRLLGGGVLFG
jgi:hypothetical protein